jgi:hypothetical protein
MEEPLARALHWHLKTLVESTLGTDLARPQLVQPGVEPALATPPGAGH